MLLSKSLVAVVGICSKYLSSAKIKRRLEVDLGLSCLRNILVLIPRLN